MQKATETRHIRPVSVHRSLCETSATLAHVQAFTAVAAKLAPVKMDLDTALASVDAVETLRNLFAGGKITVDDIMRYGANTR